MSTTIAIISLVLFVVFFKSIHLIIQTVVIYIEHMVTINAAEDFVDFDKRANIVAQQLKELGPVRVQDLPELFKKHGIPMAKS